MNNKGSNLELGTEKRQESKLMERIDFITACLVGLMKFRSCCTTPTSSLSPDVVVGSLWCILSAMSTLHSSCSQGGDCSSGSIGARSLPRDFAVTDSLSFGDRRFEEAIEDSRSIAVMDASTAYACFTCTLCVRSTVSVLVRYSSLNTFM